MPDSIVPKNNAKRPKRNHSSELVALKEALPEEGAPPVLPPESVPSMTAGTGGLLNDDAGSGLSNKKTQDIMPEYIIPIEVLKDSIEFKEIFSQKDPQKIPDIHKIIQMMKDNPLKGILNTMSPSEKDRLLNHWEELSMKARTKEKEFFNEWRKLIHMREETKKLEQQREELAKKAETNESKKFIHMREEKLKKLEQQREKVMEERRKYESYRHIVDMVEDEFDLYLGNRKE